MWWALRRFAPFVHAPTAGPWTFGPRPSYVAAPPYRVQPASEEAISRLVRRCLEGFGPASVADLAQLTLLRRPVVRGALQRLAGELAEYAGPAGEELFDVTEGLLPEEETPAQPRLLGMWDSILLAYADRSRVIPTAYRPLVTRRNGDVLPTLLVDGYVAGVWRPVPAGIEATAFGPLDSGSWAGLEAEARGLVTFLAGRESSIYRRYAHWWGSLPAHEVRLLAG